MFPIKNTRIVLDLVIAFSENEKTHPFRDGFSA